MIGRALTLTLACVAVLRGQTSPRVEIDLAACPTGSGPRAWRYARDWLATSAQLDPHAALRITWDGARLAVAPGQRSTLGAYLRARVTLESGEIQVACDHDGHEAWSIAGAATRTESYRALLAWLDLDRAGSDRAWFDAGALIGLSGPGFETESPVAVRLAVAATECGDLVVAREAAVGAERLRARSAGGLLLPAALLWRNRREAGSIDPEQRWLSLAFAARDARRDEAMLQLTRSVTASSERGLRALCLDPGTAPRALEALTRRGAVGSLTQLASLSSTPDPMTAEVARGAIATLWPRADQTQRAQTRARADRRLLDALDALDRQNASFLPQVRADEPAVPDGEPRRNLAAGLLFSAGLLVILVARRFRPPTPPQ